MTGANLSKAKLDERTRATLGKAVLKNVNLSGVDLSGLDLSEVDLSGFNLSDSKLSGVSWPTGKIVQDVVFRNSVMFSNEFGDSFDGRGDSAYRTSPNVALATASISQGFFWAQLCFTQGIQRGVSMVGVLDVPQGKRSGCAPIPSCNVDIVDDLGFSDGQSGVTVLVTLAFGSGKGTLTVSGNYRTKTVEIPNAAVVPYVRINVGYERGRIEGGHWSTCD